MHKGRLEAFSDGVIAIMITIMVLELKTPRGVDLGAMIPLIPVFISYTASFIFIGIYWNNHHHLFQIIEHVNGSVLWANLHLLFWISLVPFVTAWLGEHHTESWPVALYGIVLFFCGVAYYILVRLLLRHHPKNSALAKAIGDDFKGKISVVIYIAGIAMAFVNTTIACLLYFCVSMMWLIPDRRVERVIDHANQTKK